MAALATAISNADDALAAHAAAATRMCRAPPAASTPSSASTPSVPSPRRRPIPAPSKELLRPPELRHAEDERAARGEAGPLERGLLKRRARAEDAAATHANRAATAAARTPVVERAAEGEAWPFAASMSTGARFVFGFGFVVALWPTCFLVAWACIEAAVRMEIA